MSFEFEISNAKITPSLDLNYRAMLSVLLRNLFDREKRQTRNPDEKQNKIRKTERNQRNQSSRDHLGRMNAPRSTPISWTPSPARSAITRSVPSTPQNQEYPDIFGLAPQSSPISVASSPTVRRALAPAQVVPSVPFRLTPSPSSLSNCSSASRFAVVPSVSQSPRPRPGPGPATHIGPSSQAKQGQPSALAAAVPASPFGIVPSMSQWAAKMGKVPPKNQRKKRVLLETSTSWKQGGNSIGFRNLNQILRIIINHILSRQNFWTTFSSEI